MMTRDHSDQPRNPRLIMAGSGNRDLGVTETNETNLGEMRVKALIPLLFIIGKLAKKLRYIDIRSLNYLKYSLHFL